ncbi:MAG: HypC/HybG/HupF family hydrogenase formation chaperone [Bacteroidales bacterium]|nr:HypC/HybG/HupF family hydrogenase formation chaperone [Lentimicrobiaceae bacterium]MDD5695656.1 HypC/HybG/HupF family hydrogenase formation chaperone [Bacteroidales bacterium]
MCLSIPARVISIDGDMATVSVGGTEYRASLQIVEDVGVGDYILLHTGFAIQKLDSKEAEASLKVFDEFIELNRQLDEEEKKTGNRIL